MCLPGDVLSSTELSEKSRQMPVRQTLWCFRDEERIHFHRAKIPSGSSRTSCPVSSFARALFSLEAVIPVRDGACRGSLLMGSELAVSSPIRWDSASELMPVDPSRGHFVGG